MKRSNIMLQIIFAITLVISLVISANVFLVSIGQYHIRSNTSLADYVSSANVRTKTIKAKRGHIYDRSGNIIAQDVKTYNVYCILSKDRPSVKGEVSYVDDPLYTARVLANILEADEKKFYELLTSDRYQVELGTKGRNISKEKKEEIESYNLPGVEFTESIKRSYPLGTFASYLVGYGQSDENGTVVGKMGVELYLNDFLTGTDGYKTYQADKNGYILPGMKEEVVEEIDGNDVYLTLDQGIQETLETAVHQTIINNEASNAWGSVMEVDTGKILAMAQAPGYDPNVLVINDYNNYCTQHAYEPGSTMKSFVYAAAINEGKYRGDELVDTSPFYYKANGRTPVRTYDKEHAIGVINNARRKNWGMIPYDYGLIYSSNVITSSIITNFITPEKYDEYLHAFGFFKKVETDGLKEVTGKQNFTWPADKLSLSYGQGSSVTMLQMIQAYSAIFSDGTMVKPYYIDKVVNPSTNEVLYNGQTTVVGNPITADTAKKVQDLMYRVVYDEKGTGRHYQIPETEIIAKTGTTEIAGSGVGYDTGKTITSVMVGLPANDPKYIVYYCFEAKYDMDAHKNSDIVKSVIRKVAMTYNLQNTSVESGLQNGLKIEEHKMPNLVNHSVDYSKQKLDSTNTEIIVLGDGDTVIDQLPKSDESILTYQKVFLLTDTVSFKMVNMIGWTRNEISKLWKITGHGIKINGYGVCTSQSIPEGVIVTEDDVIEVFLE